MGRRVAVGGDPERTGVLLFLGRTHFADGIWCGVRLDQPLQGRHDGQIEVSSHVVVTGEGGAAGY